jgi:hypothetical protein
MLVWPDHPLRPWGWFGHPQTGPKGSLVAPWATTTRVSRRRRILESSQCSPRKNCPRASENNFYHKASFSSSSSSSSSRMIPAIPKLLQERLALPSSLKYQSVPMNVPVLVSAMRSQHEFDNIDDDNDGGDIKMLQRIGRTRNWVVAIKLFFFFFFVDLKNKM